MIYALYYFDRSGNRGGIVEVHTGGGEAPRAVASDADMSYTEQLSGAVSIDGSTMTVSVPGSAIEPIDEWTASVATRGRVPEISDDIPQQTGDGLGFRMIPFR